MDTARRVTPDKRPTETGPGEIKGGEHEAKSIKMLKIIKGNDCKS